MTDPHVGRLAFFRVYSGSLEKGSQILNARTGNKERMGRILEMHANDKKMLMLFMRVTLWPQSGLKMSEPEIH
ncbi:MAG: hypothetical protein CM15mP49_18820 [Actinomycetota bacterium]|nr:MAG: hypothetical protein CM15mP49_18820 [Actinomycetota bacterium]